MAIKASFVVHDVFGNLMNTSRADSNAVFIVWPESYAIQIDAYIVTNLAFPHRAVRSVFYSNWFWHRFILLLFRFDLD